MTKLKGSQCLRAVLRRYRRPRHRSPFATWPRPTRAQVTAAAGLFATAGLAIYDRLKARFGWP
jgi:hypothetical protein